MKKTLLTIIIFVFCILNANAQNVLDSLISEMDRLENATPFDEPKYSETVNSIIFTLLSIGDYYNAQVACDNGMAFLQQHGSGIDTEYMLTLLSYSGRIDMALGNHQKALEKFNAVLQLCEKSGNDNDLIFLTYNNIAMVYSNQQDYAQMKTYMDKSVSIYEAKYGSIFN